MLLLFQASGTITGGNQGKREQTMISKASLIPVCRNSDAFYKAFSRFESADWLSSLVSDVLFTTAIKVQRYFDSMGPLTKKYLMSHSSAGSSFFERIIHLQQTLGLRIHSVLKVYEAYAAHDLLPGFAVAHITGSFAGTLLEGPLFLYTLWRLSGLIASESGERRKLMMVVSAAFSGALDQFSEGDAKAYNNAFGRTLNSIDSRTRLKQKMHEHAAELSDIDAFVSIHNRLLALDCTPLRTTAQVLTEEVVNAVCGHVGVSAPAHVENLSDRLKLAMAGYLGNVDTTKRLLYRRTNGEQKTVAGRFSGLTKSSSKEAYELRLFDLFKNFAETNVAPTDNEDEDLNKGVFGATFNE